MPALLKSFAGWVKRQPHGSLGYFDGIMGDTFCDGGLTDKANQEINDATGPFIGLGEGSRVALWSFGKGKPAVVLIDSEGQHKTLADSLERFLVNWSKHKSDVDDLDAFEEERDDDDPSLAHAALATWLKTEGVHMGRKRKVPDFGEWVESFATPLSARPEEGYLKPPKDMSQRIAACVGLLVVEEPLASLLQALGVDVSTLKTEDDFRFFAIPEHGYALRFEWPKGFTSPHGPYDKGPKASLAKKSKARMLVSVEFCADKYESWNRARADYDIFKEFSGKLPMGVTFASKAASLSKKGLKPTYEGAATFVATAKGLRTMVSLVDEDEDDGPIALGCVEYVVVSLEKMPY